MRHNLRFLFIAVWIAVITVVTNAQITSAASGNWSSGATWVGGVVPSAGDVIIANGHTVTIDQNVLITNLTVGTGTSGILTFDGVAARAVTISGDITIAAGGTFITQAVGTFTNTLSIGGNVTNNGIFDMTRTATGSTLLCSVTFTKAGDQTISGTGTTTRFRAITLSKTAKTNKVISTIDVAQVGTSLFMPTGSTGTWEQTSGTFTTTSSQTTGANTALNIIGSGNWYQYVASNLTIAGDFLVNTTGTVTIGTGGNKLDITTAGASATFTAGTINVNGKVAFAGIANITLNGANLNIDPQKDINLLGTEYVFRVTTGTGTQYGVKFTAGTITILDPNAAVGTLPEFNVTSSFSMSGTAKLIFGNGASTSTSPNRGFRIFSSGTLQDVVVNTGSVGDTLVSDLIVNGTLTLTSGLVSVGANTLFLNGPAIGGTLANLIMTPSSSLSFGGSAAGITIPSFVTELNRLTINNPSGVSLTNNITVDTLLTIIKGGVILGSNTLAYAANATLIYKDTVSQTTTDGEYPAIGGPKKIMISNPQGVVLHSSRTLDSSLIFTSGKLTTGKNTLTVKGTVISAGAGKFVDGILSIPMGAVPAKKKWDVGQSADYLPFTAVFNSVTGTDLVSVSVLDKNTVAPLSLFSSESKVLRRYYRVNKGAGITLFATDSLILSYTNADVAEQGIGEDTLRVSLYKDGAWSPLTISSRDTSANTITVTGVTTFSDFVISGATLKTLVPPMLPLDFESAAVDYSFTNFSGATTTRIANPQSNGINTSGFVAKTIKGAGDPWAGSFLTLSAPVDFSKGKIFKAKVFMPKAGAKMLLKFEHLTNGAVNKEIDAVATKANEWEELTWDFSSIDATKEYQKVVVIFDLGTTGDGSANFTYLMDDIKQVAPPAVVTFQVNMKVQAKLKKFNPAKDTVIMRGNFYQGSGNWWDANDQKLTDTDGDSIYVGSFNVGAAPMRLGQYKFVLRGPDVAGDRWEVDMGVNKDRTDSIPSLPWTLPVVWFSNDSTSKYSDNLITFQVNMKKQMKFAKFNKVSDSLLVRGDFNGWAGNTHLLTDANADSIYTATFNITSVSKIIYKFVIHKTTGDTWESSKDRIDSLLNGTPRTEPVVFFENDSILTGIRRDEYAVVKEYALGQNYPNPFNPATKIDFSLLASSWVTLKVYNVVGQEVATVVDQQLEAGKHIATFNASQLTSGVYFYKIQAGTFTSIRKMMLLK